MIGRGDLLYNIAHLVKARLVLKGKPHVILYFVDQSNEERYFEDKVQATRYFRKLKTSSQIVEL